MVNLTHERQPPKRRACVVVVGMAALLVLTCHPQGEAIAQVRSLDQETVGSLKATLSVYTGWTGDAVWIHFASGAIQGAISTGVSCPQLFTVAELRAYVQFTAKDTQTVPETLSQFWSNRGCTLEKGAAGEYSRGWLEGYVDGSKETASELLLVRGIEDISRLESVVQSADAAGADALTKAKGVVAGARLLELKRRGGQAPVWRPPVPEKR